MSRRVIWTVVACMVVVTLGWLWFVTHFERVPGTRYENPKAEALRNPYLALDRFLLRMGRRLDVVSKAQALDELPGGGVLLLDRDRRRQLNPERVQGLFRWVERGGYLIVAAEQPGVGDPVLARLGVHWMEMPPRAAGAAGGSTEGPRSESDAEAKTAAVRERHRRVEANIPGSAKPLSVWMSSQGLITTERVAQWSAGELELGAALLHFSEGNGQVTVVQELRPLWSNWFIGKYDHAELVWTLLERHQPQGQVTLATRLAVPSLWEWLWEAGWAALASACVLIVLWLWRVVPRFGGLAPEAPPVRRSLAEHLAAIGRFVWRRHGLEHWLGTCRKAVLDGLLRRHPALAAAPQTELAHALGAMGAAPASEVSFALWGRVRTTAEFTTALATLQKIEHIL